VLADIPAPKDIDPGAEGTTMARHGLLIWAVLVLVIPLAAPATGAGPGEAAAGADAPTAVRQSTRNAEFKVLVWYRLADPLGTFKYEVYDLRKGQNTAPIDAWINEVRTKYPAYIVLARDVDLKREQGATDSLKVGSVIRRELAIAAAMAGIDGGGGWAPGARQGPGMSSLAPSSGLSPARRLSPPGSGGSSKSYLNPSPPLFPVPLPYPRPHP
jgi:hypothetical protein